MLILPKGLFHVILDGLCTLITADFISVATEPLGERVFHQKFGYGGVIGIEGDKVEVDFDKAGVKKVVSRFLSAKDDVPF